MHFFVFTFGSMWLRLGFAWAYLHRQSTFLLGTRFANWIPVAGSWHFVALFHISEIGGVASIAISSSLRAWTLAANHMWSHSLCFVRVMLHSPPIIFGASRFCTGSWLSCDFSYFAQAVVFFVQSYFLVCLCCHVRFLSHDLVVLISRFQKAAFSPVGRLSRVGREKRGTGRRQLGRDLYPMPFTCRFVILQCHHG